MTLPSIITNIQNKGYVERLKKNYALIQSATNAVVYDEGMPKAWGSSDNIVEFYKKQFNGARYLGYCQWGSVTASGTKMPKYTTLDGSEAPNFDDIPFMFSYPFQLADGSIIALRFKNYEVTHIEWGMPFLWFIVDVNGVKGPNKIGRDLFYLYLGDTSTSKILPYTNTKLPDGARDDRDTCGKNKNGRSCAYRVITEGKMNY